MTTTILPPATLGLLGGGQLGRFFILAAHEMGYKVWVLDPDDYSPAGRIADRHLVADYKDKGALSDIAANCAAVTTEFENVPAASLLFLSRVIASRPSAEAVHICQNRIAEKLFLRDNHLSHVPFAQIASEADIGRISLEMFPAILKSSLLGYDGKGQAVVPDHSEALAAFRDFKGAQCVLEKKLILDDEISIVLARAENGETSCFPISKNYHHEGILDTAIAPFQIDGHLANTIEDMGRHIAEKLNYVGVMTVEFFISKQRIYINEIAPRPHNSGHYTLDACVSSQYEQQVRALCGLPLAQTRAHSGSVMVNLLGDLWYTDKGYQEPAWEKLYAIPNLKLHLYGKREARPGRKMGHFTVIGDNPEELLKTALEARRAIGILHPLFE